MNTLESIIHAKHISINGTRGFEMKYGENPQQVAAYFGFDTGNPYAMEAYIELEDKPRGPINCTDVSSMQKAMLRKGAMFEHHLGYVPHIAEGAKHSNLCGSGVGKTPEEAIMKMLDGDSISIFGGSNMFNFHLTAEHATLLRTYGMPSGKRRPLNVICAPSLDDECDNLLRRRDGQSRVFVNPALMEAGLAAFNKLIELPEPIGFPGGIIFQRPMPLHLLDSLNIEKIGPTPSAAQYEDLLQGIGICATASSNTILGVRDGKLIGSGVCQKDRVGAAQLCIALAKRAGHGIRKRANGKVYPLLNATLLSDSFFPFPDGILELVNAGASFIFATRRDPERDEDIAIAKLCQRRGVTLWRAKDSEARMFARHCS